MRRALALPGLHPQGWGALPQLASAVQEAAGCLQGSSRSDDAACPTPTSLGCPSSPASIHTSPAPSYQAANGCSIPRYSAGITSPWCHSQYRGLSLWPFGRKQTPPQPAPSETTPDADTSSTGSDTVIFGDVPEPSSTASSSITQDSIMSDGSVGGLALPDEISLGDAAAAIQVACDTLESSALAAAKEDCILLGAQFINAVQAAHDQFGLPWWAAIASINILTRMATAPVVVASQRSTTSMMKMQLDLLPIRKLQEAVGRAKTREEQVHIHSQLMKRVEEMRTKHAPAITRTLATMFGTLFINSIVFISIFNGVSNLVNYQAPSLAQGGMLWFTDLTQPDPFYGLPVLCTLTTLGMIQYGMNVTGDTMASPDRAEQAERVKNIFRFMALLFIPFGHYVPSGVALLWASNSFFSVCFGLAMRQDGLRQAFGLPSMSSMHDLSEKLQALHQADPMSFASPMPSQKPPPPSPQPVFQTVEPIQTATAAPAGEQADDDLSKEERKAFMAEAVMLSDALKGLHAGAQPSETAPQGSAGVKTPSAATAIADQGAYSEAAVREAIALSEALESLQKELGKGK